MQFLEIFNEMPTGIALCTAKGEVANCNPAYLEILGVAKNEIVGYNIFDSYNFTEKEMETIQTSDSYQYDILYAVPKDVFKNTTASTISVNVKIVRHTENGETDGYMVYLTNHTNQWIENERRQASQEERYRNLVDNLPLDYTHSKLIFDENGRIVDYLNVSGNKQCEEFYIKHNMTWGKTLATEFLPISGHIILGKLNEIRDSGAVGGHFFYDITEIGEINEMVAVFEGDEWVNLISLPVTTIEQARMLAEEQLRKEQEAHERDLEKSMHRIEAANAAKTNFLFNMSHDIRTPMNAIIGFTDILEANQECPERRQDCIGKIRNASSTLLDLINNVLDMAWIENGKTKLEEQPCDVRWVFDSIASVFSGQMQQKGISFETETDFKHYYAYIDPALMQKIFANLLSNAYKYTPEGGHISFTAKELPSEKPGYATYQAVVKDNGQGMSKKFQEHLFEEFTRERTSTESRVEGSGLGMAIVKSSIDLMGGTIEVESEPDVGSAFTVTLTLRLASAEEAEKPEQRKIDTEQFQGKSILLAEDNELNAEIACEVLNAAGFKVVRTENGQACIDELCAQPAGAYDLVLMDVQMPVMNGYDATRAIRKLSDAAKANIPILAMTANAFEEDRKNAFVAGMNGHIAKPIDVEKLFAELQRVLAN